MRAGQPSVETGLSSKRVRDLSIPPTLIRLLPPILFSCFYFGNTYLRSAQKYLWLDELITNYVSRLSARSLIDVLGRGADYNPPFFFWLTKCSLALFGNTLFALRAPEILGFWLLCMSIYWLIQRQSGILAASIAMALPMATGAYYYAYEARPHAIVLGFAALAFLCWQMFQRGVPSRRLWLAGFGASLLVAFLMHCYAIVISAPFALFEIVAFIRYRRIRLPIWLSILLPAAIAIFSYVPLFLSYRQHMSGTDYARLFHPSLGVVSGFYVSLVAPCIFLVVLAIALLATSNPPRLTPTPEVLISSAFLFLPILGVVLALLLHGPFFARYFMTAILGFCVLFGLGVAQSHPTWKPALLATFLAANLFWNSGALLWHRLHGTPEVLREPSSGYDMNSSLIGPLESYKLLMTRSAGSEPVAVLDPLDFMYLLHYAPELRPRLYYVQSSPSDFFYRGLPVFHAYAPYSFNREVTKTELLRLSSHVLLYGKTAVVDELELLAPAGRMLTAPRFANQHFLVELQTLE